METPSKPLSASDIIFSENSKNNNPIPIKSIGVPTSPTRKTIYFVGWGYDNEDWRGYDSDGTKGPFLDVIADKVKDYLFDEEINLQLSMGGKGCDHHNKIGKFRRRVWKASLPVLL